MYRISQIKLNIKHSEEELLQKLSKEFGVPLDSITEYKIVKKSIDARKKSDIKYIYTIDVKLKSMTQIKSYSSNITKVKEEHYNYAPKGNESLKHRPVVVGSGPAGIFCTYLLALNGYSPLLIEQGENIEKRVTTVEHFFNTNELNESSNVQFGEGGAGTFSDGKLNTAIKDKAKRNSFVLETFNKYGADSEILYLNKPHIGTDRLRSVISSMRKDIISLGGEVRFETKLTDLLFENDKLVSVKLNEDEVIPCDVAILALGHSARDTFTMLEQKGLSMQQKSFAIGVRIEHSQDLISENQYGASYKDLPAADYKLTHQGSNGRGIYSFCMCPGGFVVNASSEKGKISVNGMSNHDRDEKNANSAMIVTVTPDDFEDDSPLSGVNFQKKWEEAAYKAGNGAIPVQLFGDLKNNCKSTKIGKIKPNIKGKYTLSDLRLTLPKYVIETLVEGINAFDNKIHGFASDDAILEGVETRTSSPVRIVRDENYESNKKGVFPCGEGAGYAGGITSAAIDGIKIFEAIADKYKPDYE